jgi:hypothetical protein
MEKNSMAYLKASFEKHVGNLCENMTEFPWEDSASYANWCAQTYYYVCHSTRLLALGGAHCDLSAQAMHRRFIDHLAEEKGHEKLASNDVKALGYSLDRFPELPQTSLFYQNQYYWLNQPNGAVIFFGWILALEGAGVKVCSQIYQRVVKAHGEKAAMFLKVHSEEDIGHLDKAFDQLTNLSPQSMEGLIKNMEQSCALYSSILREIKILSHGKQRKSA